MTVGISDILAITPSLTLGVGVTAQNVYHVKLVSGGGIEDNLAVEDMQDYIEEIYDQLDSLYPTELDFEEIKMTNITADVDLGIHSFPTLTSGTNDNEHTAPGVCALGHAKTETPGHQGRKYWGPFTENNIDHGYWDATALTGIANALSAAYGSFTSDNGRVWQPGILDRTTGELRVVQELSADDEPGYQRRRRRKVGI